MTVPQARRSAAASVLILAGGTGGHVFPALAVAQEMVSRGWSVEWLGTRRGIEHDLVPAAGFVLHLVPVSGLRGRGAGRWLAAPMMVARALVRSIRVLRRARPRVVLGMGGFVAGPAGLAAWCLGRPLVIHEQNAVAGLTNRFLRPLAVRVLEAFPGSFGAQPRGVRWTGNPVRTAIAALPAPSERLSGRGVPLRLAVIGGSQGAESLNRAVPAALEDLLGRGVVCVRHQSGRTHLVQTVSRYGGSAGVEVKAFYDDMAELYAWADLVVCRAGAMTVAELAAAGVAAILIPYPYAAGDHQAANARYLVTEGAALVVEEREATRECLSRLIESLAGDRAAVLAMSERARARGVPDAAAQIASTLEEVLDAAA